MNVLDLFSGIGGFSLGLERAGMRTVAFCEIDPYCQRVLRKHWPDVPVFGDVRTLTFADASDAAHDGHSRGSRGGANRQRILSSVASTESGQISGASESRRCGIDVICGGFPCQDISVAGKGAGIEGSRSGLWSEYARIIGEVRPRYVIVENVAALLGRGLERVLGDLAALGFDAEWHCIPASAVGAPHRRDRVWIVAYAADERLEGTKQLWISQSVSERLGNECEDVSHSAIDGRDAWRQSDSEKGARGRQWRRFSISEELVAAQCCDRWKFEPAMGELVDGVSGGLVRFEGRVAKGVPNRVQKLRALGNTVVPQVVEVIGRAIIAAENK